MKRSLSVALIVIGLCVSALGNELCAHPLYDNMADLSRQNVSIYVLDALSIYLNILDVSSGLLVFWVFAEY